MASIPLPTGSYALPDPRASCRRLVNCFAEAAPQTPQLGPNPADTKEQAPPVTLSRSAGLTLFADSGLAYPVRGMHMMQGILYAVIGAYLYSVNKNGVLTQLASSITGTGMVRMADNKVCLAILVPSATAAILFEYAPGFGFQQCQDETFLQLGAIDLGFIDSFIVFLAANGKEFYNADSADASIGFLTFSEGTEFPREFGTDLFLGMGIDHRQITFFGTDTSEMYIDAGNPTNSPFSSAPDNFIELGIGASYSVVEQDQTLFWIANDRTVRRKNGQTPLRVSNHGIETILQNADLTNCYGMAFSYRGHLFAAWTLPIEGRTIVFDVTTGEWHELQSFGLTYWRASCTVSAFGKQLVGDSQTGRIGYLDTKHFTEFGIPQTASWIHQAVYSGHKRISHERIEILLGAGQEPAYGVTPLITLYYSDDGGSTFKAFPTRSLGLKGDYSNRAFWVKLGTSRDRVYRFHLSDPLPTWAVDVQLEAAGGNF